MSIIKNLQKMNYSQDVMEVHNEFMTAEDILLKKAEEILKNEVKINPAKIERLKQFGFKSSKDNTALEDDKKVKAHHQNIVEAINYYRLKFPNYKFIPTDSVKSICEKYGLVSGEAHQYKGFVPEKNLTQIEKFFESHPYMKQTYWRKHKSGDGIISYISGDIQISKEEYDELVEKNCRKEDVSEMQTATKKAVQSFKKGMDMDIPTTSIFEKDNSNRFGYFLPSYGSIGYDPYSLGNEMSGYSFFKSRQTGRRSFQEEMFEMAKYYGFGGIGDKDYTDRFYTKETALRICAPITDMNTSGYELQDGYKLVYDPIVSVEVTHKNGIKGEIIITAWGDEASDELVIDQNKN